MTKFSFISYTIMSLMVGSMFGNLFTRLNETGKKVMAYVIVLTTLMTIQSMTYFIDCN